MSRQQVAAWVKERRKALGLSQRGLAGIIWCSPSTIGAIECGEASLRPGKWDQIRTRTAIRLADALSWDDEDRQLFLELTGQEDYTNFPRLPDIVQWRQQFALLPD